MTQSILVEELSLDSPILPESPYANRRPVLLSIAFLCSIALLSVALYVPHLGFYSDDWHFLSLLKNSQDQSFGGLFQSLMADHNVRVRPVQVLTLVALYRCFDLSPLGYHVCNAMLLTAMAIMLFLLLRELKLPWILAVALPAVYILLPHYSTDRFWIAAMQANISMVCYFISFYAVVRSLRSGWLWLVVGVLSTLVSVLSYEVAVPLFALIAIDVLWRGKFSRRARLAAALTFLAVLGCFIFKLAINQRPVMHPGTLWRHAAWLVHQAVFIDFYQLGIAYPRVFFKALVYHFDFSVFAAAVAIGLLVFFFLRWSIASQLETISQITWKRVIAAGFAVFILGYTIFFSTDQVSFHKTGVANRTSIAAALGIALCFLGIAGYFSTKLAPRLRIPAFSFLVSLICASGALINDTLAQYWVQGYEEERVVIQKIANHHFSMNLGGSFLVDGICPYIGPAPILESWWEVSGIAQLLFHRPDLNGDAISSRIRWTRDALITDIYGEEKSYPYGSRFVLYNVALDRMFVIHNSAEMERYRKDSAKFSAMNMGCPGYPGEGVPVF